MRLLRLLQTAVAAFAVFPATPCPASTDTAATWERWEIRLRAELPHANPHLDVTVPVTFTRGERSLSTFAAWDGGDTWLVRCAFPEPGEWTWRSSPTPGDPGLSREGRVSISPYTGENALYRHGLLRASEDRRHLVHDDGTPFFWLGDTAWRAPQAATAAEWLTYVEDRAAQTFNVVQISPYTRWRNTPPDNLAGEAPFTREFALLNPAYWRSLDAMVETANRKGLVVVLVGLPGWKGVIADPAERAAFVRQLTGRFFGNHVIYSPNSDEGVGDQRRLLGAEIHAASPRHLVTQHPATGDIRDYPDHNPHADGYYDDPYMGLSFNQSGHHGGERNSVARAARTWNLALDGRASARRLPFINAEAFYEGDPAAGAAKYRGTAADARLAAYTGILSGSAGFTHGVLGLWNWGLDIGGVKIDLPTALGRASHAQMRHLGEFFRPLPWWTLRPAHDLVLNQAEEETRKITLSRDAAGSLAVAYLPDNPAITFSGAGFAGPLRARWFDPVSGRFAGDAFAVPAAETITLTRPAAGPSDWVLLLQASPVR